METHSSSSPSFSFYYSGPEAVQNPPSRSLKKTVPPPAPMVPRVYKVDPINFRDVVQKLTASPEFQDRRLHSMPAPRPNLSNSNPPPHSAGRRDFSGEGSVSYNGYLGDFSQRY